MSTAARLVKLAEGLDANGVLSAAKGGTGGATGGGTASPTISAIGYGGDDTATNPAGGATVTLTGTNFASGARVLIGSTAVGVVTVVSSTQITFTAPANAAGSYILYVVNTDGSTAIAVPGIQYSGTPAWTTAAGSLGTGYETAPVSTTVSAASDSAVSYSVVSGTLPDGVVINSSGTISGTSPIVSGSTTYTFTVRATDGELQDTDRQFSLTINPDVVTWSSSNAIAVQQDAASTTTLSATSAAGQTVSYAVDTLPDGLTLSGATVSGTATTGGTTTTVATATAAVTGKTAQQTITWTVSVAADGYFPYTTLLLNAETAVVPFLADASTNNFQLTAYGDARPSNYSPYTPGYYSNYFDGNGDWLATSSTSLNTSDFTIEFWMNAANTSNRYIFTLGSDWGDQTGVQLIQFEGSFALNSGAFNWNTMGTLPPANTWAHVAIVRSGVNTKVYVNGVSSNAGIGSSATDLTATQIRICNGTGGYWPNLEGYISNLRIVKGTALYTANFTPPTEPLTAISGTVLLTCQSNRFLDTSTNVFAITKNGDTKVSSFDPFVPNSSYATYGSTYFDGTGDYLSSTAVSITPGSSDFCLEAWGYWTSFNNGTYGSPLISIGGGSPGGQLMLRANKTSASSTSANYYSQINGTFIPPAGYTSGVSAGTIYLNTWTHIALTRQGSTFRLFVNGELVNTQTDSQNYYVTFTTLHIGSDSSPANGLMTGWVADARLVIGSAVYTAAFTPPTQPLTAISGTNFLTCQTNQPVTNSQFLDNSTSALPITRNGNTTQGSFSPYGASWSNYFDGSGDYLTIANNSNLSWTGNTDGSMEAWIYLTSSSATGTILSKSDISGSSYPNYAMAIVTGGYLNGYVGRSGFPGSGLGGVTSATAIPLNTWAHVLFTRKYVGGSEQNQYRIFVNGVLRGFTTNESPADSRAADCVIGGTGGGVSPFSGYISNVRFFNNSIPVEYQTSNQTVGTTIFTPSTAPLVTVTGTQLLTCQSQNFVDNSHNAFALTRNGDTRVEKFSPFGTVTQTPTTHSVYFDGTGDYLEIANNSAFNFGTGDFTVECWANHSVTSQIQSMVSTYQGSTAGWSFQWRSDTGKLALGHGDTQLINYTFTPTVGTWYHYAVSRAGTSLKLFINGTVVATVTDSTNITSTAPLVVGNISTTIAQYTYGYLSNLRVVKGTAVYTANFTVATQPLTAVAGTSLLTCQDATIRDNSANNFALTAAGNATPRRQNPFGYTTSSAQDYTPSVFGNSAYFDGTGDYLTGPGDTGFALGTGSFTVEAWIYPTTAQGVTLVSSNYTYATAAGNWSLYFSVGSASTIYFNAGNPGAANHASSTTVTIPINAWTHIAYSRYGGNGYFYINGVQLGTAIADTSNYAGSSGLLYIGRQNDGNSQFAGYMSDFRIVKGQALYTSNFVPPSAPLTAVQNTTLLLNMDRAAVVDRSGKVVLETVGDAKVSTAQKKYGNSSLFFDGTGDYMLGANNPNLNFGTGAFTIEAWIYRVSGTGSTDWRLVGGSVNSSFFFGGRNTYSLGFGRSAVAWDLESAANVYSPDTWTHVAYVRNSSGNMNIYVNGTSIASTTNSNNYGLNGGNFQICAEKGGQNFGGYIDDLRITRGYARYTASFTPPQQALLTK